MPQWTTQEVLLFLLIIWIFYSDGFQRRKQDASLLIPAGSKRNANCECGKLTKKIDDERLTKVKIPGGRLPWLAELVTSGDLAYGMDIGSDEYRLCFGTLVSLQSVLFPASCIDRDYVHARSKPKVKLLGTLNKTEQIQEIVGVRFHPGYKGKYDHDLALVKLKNMIDFNRTKLVPICLPPPPEKHYFTKHQNNKSEVDISDYDTWKSFEKVANVEYEEKSKPCRNPHPPCTSRPCPPCPDKGKSPVPVKKPYVLDYYVPRTWFYRKSVGYEYNQYFGRFAVQKNVNDSTCHDLFPEMLKSKLDCVRQKEIKEIAKQNQRFFKQLELGMPMIVSNTTTIKGKLQPVTTKFYLEAMRAPGRSGTPLLENRDNITALLRILDYVHWIQENSEISNLCRM